MFYLFKSRKNTSIHTHAGEMGEQENALRDIYCLIAANYGIKNVSRNMYFVELIFKSCIQIAWMFFFQKIRRYFVISVFRIKYWSQRKLCKFPTFDEHYLPKFTLLNHEHTSAEYFFFNFVAILLCAHLLACKKITARDRASKIIGFTCVCLTFSGYFKEKFTEGSINKSDILFLWATPYQFFSAIQIECLSNRNSETVEIVISWKCRTIAIHSYILKEFFELECLQFHFPVA